ncbi:hypothetical protein BGX30_003650, partial [Mortierella sp. GBA39]
MVPSDSASSAAISLLLAPWPISRSSSDSLRLSGSAETAGAAAAAAVSCMATGNSP